jgi:hypothetical protein
MEPIDLYGSAHMARGRAPVAASSTYPAVRRCEEALLQAEGEVPEHVDLVLAKPPKLRDLREALARCCGTAA